MHGGGGGKCVAALGVCMAAGGGMHGSWGGMHGSRGGAWQPRAACVAAREVCLAARGMHGSWGACVGYSEIWSMSGQYASYWNAFLLTNNIILKVHLHCVKANAKFFL